MIQLKKISALVGITSLALVLSACNEDYKGTISVQEQLSFTKKKKTVTLPAGNYSAEIKATSKTNLQLEVVIDKKNKLEVDFKAEKGTKIIGADGSINLPSSMNQQPYDIVGRQDINIVNGPELDRVESCSYTDREWVCRNEKTPKKCAPDGSCVGGESREVCGMENVTKYGEQNVSYYDQDTTKTITLQLLAANSNSVAANFVGTHFKSEKIYTYKGVCASRWGGGHGGGWGRHDDRHDDFGRPPFRP